MSLGEAVTDDYAALQLSLRAHPLELLRSSLPQNPPLIPAGRLAACADGSSVTVAGLVLVRQQPGSAKGVIFMTLEDETGIANLIVWPKIFTRFRATVLGGRLLRARGRLQRQGVSPNLVIHIVVQSLDDLSADLDRLSKGADSFEPALARADEVRNPTRDNRPEFKAAPDWAGLFPSRDFH